MPCTRPAFDLGNAAWKPVITGFEVQVDDTAAGDSTKDFYGIRPEPSGARLMFIANMLTDACLD